MCVRVYCACNVVNTRQNLSNHPAIACERVSSMESSQNVAERILLAYTHTRQKKRESNDHNISVMYIWYTYTHSNQIAHSSARMSVCKEVTVHVVL